MVREETCPWCSSEPPNLMELMLHLRRYHREVYEKIISLNLPVPGQVAKGDAR